MTLIFNTTNASTLRSDILKLINNKDLKTWTIYEEHTNYVRIKHTDQWGDKGVINMTINATNNQLIVKVQKFDTTKEEVKDFEGYYLGRFCEVIFVNFPSRFSSINKE